ncbi:MAG TPA: 4-hydroxy-3-methylbut-2-enyl diphosphate reductase [Paludibacteraceae bacterium]|nr:4-hydroxy-3-methylbut-2-enyl diphosphate reductase [Paludibacteraceae bacterium]HRS24032.1 4-hydroxy-3-methylbut-2-enyl diphosphate reductase [Paludibacteraceae bacterium]HRT78386.1 4-hydroxy-3-methylbut-2-enyl diphosphate reductase [Paludibacteraceae bacterium]
MLNIEIDNKSGFCFGVVKAIEKAEEELEKGSTLYCLGDIVHNEEEVERLQRLGLVTVNYEQYNQLHNVKVLIRAHGEPPSTYETARKNNITLIDATCPVVLKLQSRIKKNYEELASEDGQIVIYGQTGHAEVKGLVGQTDGKAIVIEEEKDLDKIDFSKKVHLFSQTTKDIEHYHHLIEEISKRMVKKDDFKFSDTICRQVANRIPNIINFAQQNDVILFVGGKQSSNGKVLYEHCKSINPQTYYISDCKQVDELEIQKDKKIGICGATSTPKWLMDCIAKRLEERLA